MKEIDAERPWLLQDTAPDGTTTYFAKLYFPTFEAPSIFGHFRTVEQAEEFYERVEDMTADFITELHNTLVFQVGGETEKEHVAGEA